MVDVAWEHLATTLGDLVLVTAAITVLAALASWAVELFSSRATRAHEQEHEQATELAPVLHFQPRNVRVLRPGRDRPWDWGGPEGAA